MPEENQPKGGTFVAMVYTEKISLDAKMRNTSGMDLGVARTAIPALGLMRRQLPVGSQRFSVILASRQTVSLSRFSVL